MRTVGVYKGTEIDEDKVTMLREMARKRYAKPIYDSSYWSIENVEQLACIHGVNVENEILVLGEDWFLCYTFLENEVEFLEWVSLDNPNTKFIQSIEMMNALKDIFLQHKQKKFKTSMRHNGSYPFYLNMLQKGYFKELSHTLEIDNCNGFAPEEVRYILYYYPSIDAFLNSAESEFNPDYLTYILHSLEFYVTDAYVEKYTRARLK